MYNPDAHIPAVEGSLDPVGHRLEGRTLEVVGSPVG